MNIFWGLMGYLPVLLCGLLLYWILVALPRWFRTKPKGDVTRLQANDVDSPVFGAIPQFRRRSLVSPTSTEKPGAVFPQVAQAKASVNTSNGSGISAKRPLAAVSEPVSVVLCRQVPPATMASARSWLGGLPHMPEDVEWPRSISSESPQKGERPLHFLAQICCADLPRELWGGLGPREGWLLLFIDPNQGCPEGSDAFRILHIPQFGPEREAPFDLGPVHDGVYTGGSYDWLPKQEIPPVWRRWPIDIVSFPNVLHHNEGRSFATPEGFAQTLYEGAPILPYGELKPVRPYLVGQALKSVHNLAASMRIDPRPVVDKHTQDLLNADHSLNQLRESLTEQLAKVAERAESDHRTLNMERLNRTLTLVASCDPPALLQQRLEEEREQLKQWRLSVARDCDEMAELLAAQAEDAPLSQDDWEALQARFAGREYRTLDLRIDYRTGGSKQLDLRERIETANLAIPRGTTEEALADWLDTERRRHVPTDRIPDLEAAARSLRSDRPHRMGGYHDGVQSDATEGPKSELLLLQIASDDGMDWCWGDVGAYYFWIRPQHLDALDFSGVEMWLECH